MSVGTVVGVQLADLINWRFAIGLIVIVSIVVFISISILLPNFNMPAAPNL